MSTIKLSQGQIALVDDDDFEFLNRFNWYCTRGYAVRTTKDKTLMHKLLMNVPKLKKGETRIEVDHINTDKLDNRRSNLRLVTSSQNKMNNKVRVDNSSGYKGVSWDRKSRAFAAYIWIDKRKRHLGYFDSAIKAAVAYNKAARDYFQEFARLNKLREGN